MFKKIILTTALLATTTSIALADATPYVGASVNYNQPTYTLKDAFNNKTTFHAQGFNGGLFAGYGAIVNQNVYLGGEAFYSNGSLVSKTKVMNNGQDTANLKSTYSIGLSFLPGMQVTPSTLVYARAGIVGTRFTLSENVTHSGTGSSVIGATSSSHAQTVTGGQIGFGAQTAITPKVDLRGEFVHTNYSSFNSFSGITFSNYSVKPQNNQLNVGLAYKFG